MCISTIPSDPVQSIPVQTPYSNTTLCVQFLSFCLVSSLHFSQRFLSSPRLSSSLLPSPPFSLINQSFVPYPFAVLKWIS